MKIVRTGKSRTVIVVFDSAIKIPTLRYGVKNFLLGWIANTKEKEWSTQNLVGLCPVKFSTLFSFIIIMKRVKVCDSNEYIDLSQFIDLPYNDNKPENFGWLDGALVKIDYGSNIEDFM